MTSFSRGKKNSVMHDAPCQRGDTILPAVDSGILLAVLIIAFFCLEFRNPYYFLQDDNRTFYLPLMVHSWRAISGGEMPLYNFHQFMGAPMTAFPWTGFSVLPNLSVALCRSVLGNTSGAIDVLAFLYLMVGMVGTCAFARGLLADRAAGLFAGITWPLCSFVIFSGTSWVVVFVVVAYLPWALFFGHRLLVRPGPVPLIGFVLANVALFYEGHPQFFVYALGFEALFLTALGAIEARDARADSILRSGARVALGYLLVAAACLPLGLPLVGQISDSAERSSALTYRTFSEFPAGLGTWAWGLLDPLKKDSLYFLHPLGEWGTRVVPYLTFAGYLLPVVVLIAVYSLLAKSTMRRERMVILLTFGLLGISLVLAAGWLNPILYHLPLLNRFRWSFKYLLFSQLFLTLIGSAGFMTAKRWLVAKKPWALVGVGTLLSVQAASLVGLYALSPPRSLNYRQHRDALPLNESLRGELANGRILTLGNDNDAFYASSSLGFNYATLWGLDSLGGYANLLSAEQRRRALDLNFDSTYDGRVFPIGYLRELGVRYYILPKDSRGRVLAGQYLPGLTSHGIALAHEDEHRAVYEDKNALPLAYWQDSANMEGIHLSVGANQIQVRCERAAGGLVVVNYYANPFLSALLDGNRSLQVLATPQKQIAVNVPPGTHQVTIRYVDPTLARGLSWGGGTWMIMLAGVYLGRRRLGLAPVSQGEGLAGDELAPADTLS